jgi:NAD(P)-dependent dehydrogenase (short-subunit alcohol dehydrogenase family)
MSGKTVVVTGATGGLGKAIATALAREGALVAVVGRSGERVADCMNEIGRRVPNARLEPFSCDLSSQASLRRATKDFLERHTTLDVLVNAAGVFRKHRQVTADGLELTFATNVMAYFLLTNLLLEALVRAAPSRIVNIASLYGGATVAFDDLQTAKGK